MSEVIPVAVTEILGEGEEKSNIPIAEIREEKEEEKKCCCLKNYVMVKFLETIIISFIAFCVLYICNYMGIRHGWEEKVGKGGPDENGRYYFNFTFAFQFCYLISIIAPYHMFFGRNIFIKQYVSFALIKKKRAAFKKIVWLLNNNKIKHCEDKRREETELNKQQIIAKYDKDIKDHMLEGNIYYNQNDEIMVLWNPLSNSKIFECCSKTNQKRRKNFKNQPLFFKMFVAFHIITFIVVYILSIIGKDKWFSTMGAEIERNNSLTVPPFGMYKIIDYDNEFISVLVWTGYIVGFWPYWAGVLVLTAFWILFAAITVVSYCIILIIDILWCFADCLICYFSPSAWERLVRRKDSYSNKDYRDVWLYKSIENKVVQKKTIEDELDEAYLANLDDPIFKIGYKLDMINSVTINKNILENYFKYRYGREPITWGQVQDTTGEHKTNDVTNPSAPKLEP